MKRPKSSVFQFREFALHQNKQVMPLTTDAILLGAWTHAEDSVHLLEVGTGTGILSLMMAQRFPTLKITAIDISEKATALAADNVDKSPWSDRIEVHQSDFRVVKKSDFDHLLCNPPYFKSSLRSPDSVKTRSKHTHFLSAENLMVKGVDWLPMGGKLSLICTTDDLDSLIKQSESLNYHCSRICLVATKKGKKPTRALMEFIFQSPDNKETTTEDLYIYGENEEYSLAYKKLSREFYL